MTGNNTTDKKLSLQGFDIVMIMILKSQVTMLHDMTYILTNLRNIIIYLPRYFARADLQEISLGLYGII